MLMLGVLIAGKTVKNRAKESWFFNLNLIRMRAALFEELLLLWLFVSEGLLLDLSIQAQILKIMRE